VRTLHDAFDRLTTSLQRADSFTSVATVNFHEPLVLFLSIFMYSLHRLLPLATPSLRNSTRRSPATVAQLTWLLGHPVIILTNNLRWSISFRLLSNTPDVYRWLHKVIFGLANRCVQRLRLAPAPCFSCDGEWGFYVIDGLLMCIVSLDDLSSNNDQISMGTLEVENTSCTTVILLKTAPPSRDRCGNPTLFAY
jgi:hypothetical protein